MSQRRNLDGVQEGGQSEGASPSGSAGASRSGGSLSRTGEFERPPRVNPAASKMVSGEYATVRASEGALVAANEREVPRGASRLCDTVRLAASNAEGIVHLVDGEVAWVGTRGFGLPSFHRRLLDLGLVQEHELENVLALCRSEKLNFSEMLMELDIVQEDALIKAMRSHVAAHLKALLALDDLSASWSRGSVSFTGDLTVSLGAVLALREIERWGQLVGEAGGTTTDRRRSERLLLTVAANVETPRGHLIMTSENLSRAGALFQTPSLLEVGSDLVVRLDGRLELRATVVRFRRVSSVAPQAVGVAWKDLAEGPRRALQKLLDAGRG